MPKVNGESSDAADNGVTVADPTSSSTSPASKKSLDQVESSSSKSPPALASNSSSKPAERLLVKAKCALTKMKPGIIIQCSHGKVLYAKREALVKHSTYFNTLLTKDPKPNTIDFPDVDSVFMGTYITAATRQGGLLKKKSKTVPWGFFVNEFGTHNISSMVEVYRLCDRFHNLELAKDLTTVLIRSIRDAGGYIDRVACSFKKLLSTSPLQASLRRIIIKFVCIKWDMKIFYTCSDIFKGHPQFAFLFAKQ
ncbi:hypothetical protein CSOJ01_09906 [Colletotrichum sojae]|uniref:BTB domain-containing protein n=1 Tax=Colletotrichum sojae TaxID=2175907 RepID=A0A8H6J2M6_9PEZI|nr:hypothetical protein CSOJ01_09906 [Colletotrichum sojae]